MSLYMHFEGRKRVPRSGANLVTWPLVRRNGTGFGYFVTFSRWVSISCDHGRFLPLASACRHRTAGVFSGDTTNTSQCHSCDWENVQHLEDGIGEATLPYLQACTRSCYGQVGRVLPENCWIRCAYHCNGYVFKIIFLIYCNIKDLLVLDLRKKFKHFTKNWDIKLQEDVKAMVQKKVCPLHYYKLLHNIKISFQVYRLGALWIPQPTDKPWTSVAVAIKKNLGLH